MAARQPEAPLTDQQALDGAMQMPSAEVDARIAKMAAGEAVDKFDNAALLRRRVELGNALDDAIASGDSVAQQSVGQELAKWVEADTIGGATQGRGLQSRKMMADRDNSLAGRVIDAIDAKGGEALNPEEMKDVQAAHQAFEAANAELAGLGALASEKRAGIAVDAMEREVQNSKQRRKRREHYHAQVERQYEVANRWGVDPKQVRQLAEERADATREAARAYNSALSAASLRFMTRGKIEALRNQNKDPATQPGLDVKAVDIANDPDLAVLGLRGEGKNHVADLIALIAKGRANEPAWHDPKVLEAAAKSLSTEKQARGEYGDAWTPPEAPVEAAKSKGVRKRAATPSRAERFDSWWQNTVDSAKARLKDIKFTSGLDPQMAADLAIVGADYIKRGARQAAVWAKKMAADFGEAIRPHLKAVWNASHDRLRTAEADFKKGSPEEQVEKASKTIAQRVAKKGVISAKAVHALARAVIDSGVHGRDPVAAAVHQILQGIQPDITIRETHDLISTRGDVRLPRQDPTSRELTDIKRQLALIENIAGLRETPAEEPLGRGFKRQEPSDAETLLREAFNREKKLHPEIFAQSENQLQGALQSAEKSILRRIADAEREIGQRSAGASLRQRLAELRKLPANEQRGALITELERHIQNLEEILTRKRPVSLSSPKLEAGRAKLATLRSHVEELRQHDPQFQADEYQRWLTMRKRQLTTRLDEIESRTAEMAATGLLFPKKPPRQRDLDKEGLTLRVAVEDANAKQAVVKERIRRKNLEWGPWLWEGLGELTALLPRTLMLGLEMSPVNLQGAIYNTSHPIMAFRNILGALGSVIDKRIALAKHERLSERLNWQNGEYARGKLDITEATGPLSKIEEMYQSAIIRWLASSKAEMLLPLRLLAKAYMATERGVRTFSNTMRADLFDVQKADTLAIRQFFTDYGITKERPWTEQNAKDVARTSNIFSGRGTDINFGERSGWWWLAPRWVWSRFQVEYILPLQLVTPKFIGRWNADAAMRLAYVKLGIQSLAGMATVMGLRYLAYSWMAGDDEDKQPTIEWDPRSGDFLTQKTGNTRIESIGGLRSSATLVARILSGTTKTAKGEIRNIRATAENPVPFGKDDAADVVFKWVRYKLGPAPSGILDLFSGSNAVGDIVTPTDIVVTRLTPLTYRDMYEAEKELGMKQGTAASLEAFFGSRVSTYEPKQPKQKSKGLKIGKIR